MSSYDEPGPDDDLFKQLADIEPPTDEINVRLLSNVEISNLFGDIRQELIDTGQMLEPTTEAGRELHSRRAALLIEMERRWPGRGNQ